MKKRVGILGILIAILMMAIGYAAATTIPLVITGTGTVSENPNGYEVKFIEVSNMTGDGTKNATIIDDTHATINVSGLQKTGEKASFTYVVKNTSSEAINAILNTPTISNDNETYFKVTATVNSPTTLAVGETTTITVVVEAIKTPLGNDQTSNITVTVNASPVEA